MAIAERKDVSPEEGKKKYGDVNYADETNKKYPLDSEEHVRAAWSYINMPKNASKYSSGDLAKIKGKIRAAMKRIGAKVDAESSLVFASMSADLDGKTPTKIVYMPKGNWKLTPNVNGQPAEIEVSVDESAVGILQSALEKRLADSVRPYAAFDHKPGPASFLPKQFEWDVDRGVVLEVDWTKAGSDAVAGRDYSYFSPTFLLSGKKVAGLPKDGEIGSLTNNPAFRKIERIAASMDKIDACIGTCPDCSKKSSFGDADPGDNVECPGCGNKFKIPGGEDNKKMESTMASVTEELVRLQVISAEQAESADDAFIIRAINGLHGALVTTQKANEMLSTENTDLKLKVQAVQTTEAETLIQAAIKEGKIPPKDADTIKFFKEQYLAHPEQTKKVLASLPGNDVISGKPWIDVTAKDVGRVLSQSSYERMDAMKRAVQKIQAANPNLSHDACFNLAREENSTLFVES